MFEMKNDTLPPLLWLRHFFSCHSMFQMGFVYLEVAIQGLSMKIMCILIGTALSRVLFAPWLLVIDRRPKSSFRARQVLEELRGSRKRRFRTDSAWWWGQWCFWSLSTSKKNLMRRFRLPLNLNKKKLKRPIWFFFFKSWRPFLIGQHLFCPWGGHFFLHCFW